MKIASVILAILLGFSALIYVFYPKEYSESEAEAAFAAITNKGFDRSSADRLIQQYRISDASFRIHFLAYGHIAALKSPKSFSEKYNDQWNSMIKDISDHGQMAAEDWFTPDKYSAIRAQLGYSPTF